MAIEIVNIGKVTKREMENYVREDQNLKTHPLHGTLLYPRNYLRSCIYIFTDVNAFLYLEVINL